MLELSNNNILQEFVSSIANKRKIKKSYTTKEKKCVNLDAQTLHEIVTECGRVIFALASTCLSGMSISINETPANSI